MAPDALTDEELLERVARDRDETAFSTLYERYARAIYSLVMRILRDRHTGEDVAQEAFAAVWRAAAGYHRGRGSAAGWMFAIARNAAIDASRARVPLVVGEFPDRPDPAPLPDAQVIADLEAFRVHVAVDSLPPARARGDRARVLQRARPERDRRGARSAAGHGQDTHPNRTGADGADAARGGQAVSDDAEFGHVERMLQRTPAPEFLPATLAPAARRAALGEPPSVARAPRAWRWPAWWRVASVAAALGAAVAVAVVLAVGGRGGFQTQYSLTLTGPHGATAVVDFGQASKGVRPMVVHIHGLPPAGAAHYYEMWFRTGGNDNVSAVTFDTAARRPGNVPRGHPRRDELAQLLGDARGDRRPRDARDGALHLALRPCGSRPDPGAILSPSRGYSSVGRAPGSHPGGQGFESP